MWIEGHKIMISYTFLQLAKRENQQLAKASRTAEDIDNLLFSIFLTFQNNQGLPTFQLQKYSFTSTTTK